MLRIPALLLVAMSLATQAIGGDKTIRYPDCYCTDRNGQRVELGTSLCMVVDGSDFVARCEMSLNNPIWRKIRDGCLNAGATSIPVTGSQPAPKPSVNPPSAS
ncbi:MAG: hypothetical protein OXI81_02495 [Paracoccaceae bacterium]|nr:hypothetical protein [Paracoccaceae bacterium]MDE2914816.1 hypothetical protein [Paracoccaceae bacterium]